MTQHPVLTLAKRTGCAFAGITLIAAASVMPAVAAESVSHPDYPKVLQQMADAGKIRVMKQFATDKPGMTGYVVRRDGYQTVIYGEDGYLMLGPLYGPRGQNLSRQYARQYQSKPDVTQIIDELDRKQRISQGPADAPTLYVFADPNCIFCHKLYQQIKPLVSAGRLRVHWLMVGVLGPSSVGRAVTILEAKQPAEALARNEAGFDVAHEQGGVAVTKSDASMTSVNQILEENRQAMFDAGGRGTPTVLFRDTNGHWQARQGLPPDGWLKQYAREDAS